MSDTRLSNFHPEVTIFSCRLRLTGSQIAF